MSVEMIALTGFVLAVAAFLPLKRLLWDDDAVYETGDAGEDAADLPLRVKK